VADDAERKAAEVIAADAERVVADQHRIEDDAVRVGHDDQRVERDVARTDADAAAMLTLSESIGDMVDVVVHIAGEMRAMDERRTVEVKEFATGMRRLRMLTRLAGAGIALLLVMAWWNHSSLAASKSSNGLLVSCTTAGPNPPPDTGHACYDEGRKATGGAIADLRRSIDCVALYAIGQRPTACVAVDARMDDIRAGGDPFSPTPITTTTTGAP
jgi:hypothetical protein